MEKTVTQAFFDELQKIAGVKKTLGLLGLGAATGALGLKGIQVAKNRYDIGKMVEEQQDAAQQGQ